jgi:hypothetical protein
MQTYFHPLDPDCPAVQALADRHLVSYLGLACEHKAHRLICERCQRYGAANIQPVSDGTQNPHPGQ